MPAAREDLLAGYRFYERQSEGIGRYFLDSLYSDIESLALSAGVQPVFFDRYHRMLCRRFPFAIYYRVYGEEVLVYAVLDCRRRPAVLRKRLNE